MNSREIIKRCVHFDQPPRVGLYFGIFGEEWNDTVNVFEFFVKDENGVDPWGTKFTDILEASTIGIPLDYPLADDPDPSQLTIPDPKVYADMVIENLRNLAPEKKDKYRFIAASSGIWERVQYFRGMEQIMQDMLFDADYVHRLLKLCTDFWVEFLGELASVADELDGIYMFDDWGTQENIMVSPAMWREFFAAPYRRITQATHDNGMDFWLHSCGCVTKLIGDFIDVGMDLVNPYQSKTCGYEQVAEQYAGKIAFLTTVDTQRTLPGGSKQQILDECELLKSWGTDQGGLIVAGYGYDIPQENEQLVLDFFTDRKSGQ